MVFPNLAKYSSNPNESGDLMGMGEMRNEIKTFTYSKYRTMMFGSSGLSSDPTEGMGKRLRSEQRE